MRNEQGAEAFLAEQQLDSERRRESQARWRALRHLTARRLRGWFSALRR